MAKKKPAKKKTAPKKAKKPAAKKAAPKKAAPKAKAGKKAKAPKRSRGVAPVVLPWRQPLPGESLVGVVDDFFSHVGVITFTVRAAFEVGDQIHVRGHTTDLTLRVTSMQEDHKPIQKASPKQGVGIKIDGKARRGDYVYLID
jgi:hypothetical protein